MVPHAAAALAAALIALQPAPSWLKPATRLSAEASIEAAPPGAKARTIMVAVDVTPAAGIHVYAPGNEDYIPVELKVDASPGLKPGAPTYPPAEPFVFGDLKEIVQVYAKRFRIRVPVAWDGSAPRPSTLSLTLRYQACTDKVCYPPATLPLAVSLPPVR